MRSWHMTYTVNHVSTHYLQINRGYHETVTLFYIHMVDEALQKLSLPDVTFDEFIVNNSYLTDSQLLFQYYTLQTINSADAKAGYYQLL